MRLTSDEIAAIQECAARHFGEGAVVRLFGSRIREDADGGDIDLHITTELGERAPLGTRANFLEALEHRIGDQPVDLLLHARSDQRRPIDDIAILTGRVLAGPPVQAWPGLDAAARIRMTEDAYRRLVADAVAGGRLTSARLRDTLAELRPKLPFDAPALDSQSRLDRFMTDSLLLQYGNLVAIVQDQLLRGLLLVTEGKLETRNREAQRMRAEKIGILPAGLGFTAMAHARNRVAHQYPTDPAKQATALNEVAAAVPLAIAAFEVLAAYAEEHVLRAALADDGR